MKPRLLFKDYFQDELNGVKFTVSNIHVIAIIPTTDYLNKRTRLDFNNIPLDLGRSPTPLLYTDGLYWDYQESPKLKEELRNNVRGLYDVFKENKREKTKHTDLFYELPNIICKIFDDDPELKSRLQEALIFNISLENGTKINTSEESNANVAIAKRMLYQLQRQGLHWTEIRDYPDDVTILSILRRCAEQKEVKLKELTVILIVDGLQTALINQNDGMNKESLFYSLMTEISLLATNRDSPFVIACCTATLARPFHQVVANSHQQRGNLIFKEMPLHGSYSCLPEDLSRLGLIKFEKRDEFSSEGTLTCPYIWLWLMANASKSDSILRHWNFEFYSELQGGGDPTIPPGCQFWQHFEHFIASFRVLKSNVFEIDKEIKLQDIHAGAKHNFGTTIFRNIPLSLNKVTHQLSTKSSVYSANTTVTCKRGDDQINIDLKDASACIINGSSAPAGDSFCPIYFANSSQLHTESHQCKCLKSKIVNQTTFNEVHEKACDKDDIFILYTCGRSIVERRAFLLVENDKFNTNNCTRTELTSIYGIGPKRALLLESMRPYDDLEDCINKTKIPHKYLINFRFD
ncbi:hypothetical protein C1646_741943 [Rhizophagus diaphanus]|nr:hypothetical protein C1646_741943 [Rhizophagus diaphanus] [Rhizophagus sp. MUCL 43196]